MPFVNSQANSPERITHLLDQYKAASKDWKNTMVHDIDHLNKQEQEALKRVVNLQRQLLGRPVQE